MAELSIAVDYWDVKIKQAITQKSEIQVLSNPTVYKDFIYRYNPVKLDAAHYFTGGWFDDGKQTGAIKGSTNPDYPLAYVYLPYDNAAKFFAAGVDLNLQFKQKISGIGSLGINLDGTYYQTRLPELRRTVYYGHRCLQRLRAGAALAACLDVQLRQWAMERLADQQLLGRLQRLHQPRCRGRRQLPGRPQGAGH